MTTTRIEQHINAPPSTVYEAFLNADSIAQWMVPDGMTSEVHEFEPREGGSFRVSLTYDDPSASGKTSGHTDTYHGRFVSLEKNQRIVEVVEFETTDPGMQGEMKITIYLAAAGSGTDLMAEHEDLPSALRPEDNELGWRMSLAKLANLLEASGSPY